MCYIRWAVLLIDLVMAKLYCYVRNSIGVVFCCNAMLLMSLNFSKVSTNWMAWFFLVQGILSLCEKSFFFSLLDLTNISDYCFRFTDRGRLFAKLEVQTLQIGPGGLFFTGDQTGLLTNGMVFISYSKQCTVFWVHFPMYSIAYFE